MLKRTAPVLPQASGPERARLVLARGDVLFRCGEPRVRLYLLETGSIGLYWGHRQGACEAVEFTFAGDVVGFGLLPHHTFTAIALGPSRLRSLPLTATEKLRARSERDERRYRETIAREFLARREELAAAFPDQPVRRLAALLVALSQLNFYEGRDESLIGDVFDCQTVAGWLAVEIGTLAEALVALERRGLIAHSPPSDLRILDLSGLAALAEEQLPST